MINPNYISNDDELVKTINKVNSDINEINTDIIKIKNNNSISSIVESSGLDKVPEVSNVVKSLKSDTIESNSYYTTTVACAYAIYIMNICIPPTKSFMFNKPQDFIKTNRSTFPNDDTYNNIFKNEYLNMEVKDFIDIQVDNSETLTDTLSKYTELRDKILSSYNSLYGEIQDDNKDITTTFDNFTDYNNDGDYIDPEDRTDIQNYYYSCIPNQYYGKSSIMVNNEVTNIDTPPDNVGFLVNDKNGYVFIDDINRFNFIEYIINNCKEIKANENVDLYNIDEYDYNNLPTSTISFITKIVNNELSAENLTSLTHTDDYTILINKPALMLFLTNIKNKYTINNIFLYSPLYVNNTYSTAVYKTYFSFTNNTDSKQKYAILTQYYYLNSVINGINLFDATKIIYLLHYNDYLDECAKLLVHPKINNNLVYYTTTVANAYMLKQLINNIPMTGYLVSYSINDCIKMKEQFQSSLDDNKLILNEMSYMKIEDNVDFLQNVTYDTYTNLLNIYNDVYNRFKNVYNTVYSSFKSNALNVNFTQYSSIIAQSDLRTKYNYISNDEKYIYSQCPYVYNDVSILNYKNKDYDLSYNITKNVERYYQLLPDLSTDVYNYINTADVDNNKTSDLYLNKRFALFNTENYFDLFTNIINNLQSVPTNKIDELVQLSRFNADNILSSNDKNTIHDIFINKKSISTINKITYKDYDYTIIVDKSLLRQIYNKIQSNYKISNIFNLMPLYNNNKYYTSLVGISRYNDGDDITKLNIYNECVFSDSVIKSMKLIGKDQSMYLIKYTDYLEMYNSIFTEVIYSDSNLININSLYVVNLLTYTASLNERLSYIINSINVIDNLTLGNYINNLKNDIDTLSTKLYNISNFNTLNTSNIATANNLIQNLIYTLNNIQQLNNRISIDRLTNARKIRTYYDVLSNSITTEKYNALAR